MLFMALRIFLFAVGWPRGTRCPINAGHKGRLLHSRPRCTVYVRIHHIIDIGGWLTYALRSMIVSVLNLIEGRSQSAFSFQLSPICQTTTKYDCVRWSIWIHGFPISADHKGWLLHCKPPCIIIGRQNNILTTCSLESIYRAGVLIGTRQRRIIRRACQLTQIELSKGRMDPRVNDGLSTNIGCVRTVELISMLSPVSKRWYNCDQILSVQPKTTLQTVESNLRG